MNAVPGYDQLEGNYEFCSDALASRFRWRLRVSTGLTLDFISPLL